MEFLNEIVNTLSSILSSIFLPLIGALMFYDARRRKEEATAHKEEAVAQKADTDNITSYAAEWKELYEKKEAKIQEQDNKIDQLYAEKNEDRQRIRELMEKNTALELENQKLAVKRCDVRGCDKRQPPNDY